MALWGCYLLSFQTGIRGGHLYIFGEIVPAAGVCESSLVVCAHEHGAMIVGAG